MTSSGRFAWLRVSAHSGCFLTTSKSAADTSPGIEDRLRHADLSAVVSQLPSRIARRISSGGTALGDLQGERRHAVAMPRVYGPSARSSGRSTAGCFVPSRRERTTRYRHNPSSTVRTISSSTHGSRGSGTPLPGDRLGGGGKAGVSVRRTLTVSGERSRTRESSSSHASRREVVGNDDRHRLPPYDPSASSRPRRAGSARPGSGTGAPARSGRSHRRRRTGRRYPPTDTSSTTRSRAVSVLHRQTSATTGIRTVNAVPFPGSLRTVISRCASLRCRR